MRSPARSSTAGCSSTPRRLLSTRSRPTLRRFAPPAGARASASRRARAASRKSQAAARPATRRRRRQAAPAKPRTARSPRPSPRPGQRSRPTPRAASAPSRRLYTAEARGVPPPQRAQPGAARPRLSEDGDRPEVVMARAQRGPDFQAEWPREESNLRTWIRSPPLYPLSYGAWTARGRASRTTSGGSVLAEGAREQHPAKPDAAAILSLPAVAVAQLVEPRVVVPVVVGSSPIRHLTAPTTASPSSGRSSSPPSARAGPRRAPRSPSRRTPAGRPACGW